jgi:hypothetical protein
LPVCDPSLKLHGVFCVCGCVCGCVCLGLTNVCACITRDYICVCIVCAVDASPQLKESAGCRSRHFKDYCDRAVAKEEFR